MFSIVHCESKNKTPYSLLDSEQNFLQNKYCIAHNTLQMLLHYLVKLQWFTNRINSKNTLLKDVVLKYFCGCTCLISFSRQIRVSIKSYEISLRIKYSVRDLTYDNHEPQWHNKRKIKQMTSALHLVTIKFSKLWIPSNPYILLDKNHEKII